MTWYNNKFSNQYTRAKETLTGQTFGDDSAKLLRELRSLMTETGFDAGKASSLDDLRKRVGESGGSGFMKSPQCVTEDVGTLGVIGVGNPSTAKSTVTMSADMRSKAAAVKFLRHVYLLKKFGSHRVWVSSLPTGFTDWPHFAFASRTTVGDIQSLLKESSEIFSSEDKKNLSNATQHALRWCHKTLSTLGSAKGRALTTERKKNASRELVGRWFADENTTDEQLDSHISELTAGFKAITAAISRGQMVFTDFVPLRNASAQDEIDLLNSEAFVWPKGGREKLDVVYIEREFFGQNNVLTGLANWTRIVIHELSHLVVGTDDVSAGANARYAWYGIAPHAAGFPSADAITNAENWAFFAGDCAGAISDGERQRALTVK